MQTKLVQLLVSVTAFLVSGLAAQSQSVDYNRIVPPPGSRPATFEDYLVQLAWINNPETTIMDLRKSKEQKEVDLKRQSWKDDVQFGFNINEVSLANVLNPSADNLIIYPLYQFSTSISLGTFTTKKKEREIEEDDVKIADEQAKLHKLRIRAETLSRYHKLLLAIETLKLRSQAEEDALNTFNFVKRSFEKMEVTLDDMLRASANYTDATEKRLAAATDVELARLALEEMIGVKWVSLTKIRERYNQ